MSTTSVLSIGAAAFLLALGIVLWSESAGAMFRAMVEAGYLMCQ
ncbi:hypothetical protein [Acuticoccus kandeliae]|nr:hypothetical protein [Acuticoccus kandeliae]